MVIWGHRIAGRFLFDHQDVLADNVLVSGDPADPESGQKIFRKTSVHGTLPVVSKDFTDGKDALRILARRTDCLPVPRRRISRQSASFLRLSRLHVFHPFIFNPSDFRAGS